MDTATATAENRPEQPAKVVETAGMVFADGSALELVSISADNKPGLLFWEEGKAPVVALQVERSGTIYCPPSIDPSVWPVITLPSEIVHRGQDAEMFSETADLFKTYVGMSTAEAALFTACNTVGWFADVLLNLLTLFLYGLDMNVAMTLLRLLSCIGRHALILTDIDRAAIRWLTKIQATLLLNQPQMSPRLRGLCSASNFQGVVLPGPNGSVLKGACSKAIFVGNPGAPLNDPGIHFFLPPSIDCPPLDVATQLQIKQRFQPWYLSYRLTHLREVQQSRFVGTDLSSPMGEIEAMLQSCTLNEDQLKLGWAPLLKSQEQDALAQRSWDPVAASTEVVWPRIHSSEKSITVKELTGLANTLLRSRGENREYSPEELGKRLKNQGVCRHRRSSGMVLLFDQPTRRRFHQIARSVGVGKRMAECPDCEEMQIAAE